MSGRHHGTARAADTDIPGVSSRILPVRRVVLVEQTVQRFPFAPRENCDLPLAPPHDQMSPVPKLHRSSDAPEAAPPPSRPCSPAAARDPSWPPPAAVKLLLVDRVKSLPARLGVRHSTSTFASRTTRSNTVLVHPSLRDAL